MAVIAVATLFCARRWFCSLSGFGIEQEFHFAAPRAVNVTTGVAETSAATARKAVLSTQTAVIDFGVVVALVVAVVFR